MLFYRPAETKYEFIAPTKYGPVRFSALPEFGYLIFQFGGSRNFDSGRWMFRIRM